MRKLIFLLFIVTCVHSASAQVTFSVDSFYNTTSASYWYIIYRLPAGGAMGPAIVEFPGAGEIGTDTTVRLREGVSFAWFIKQGWHGNPLGKNPGWYFILPNTPGGPSYHPQYLRLTLDALRSKFGAYIDTNRITAGGLSRGAGYVAQGIEATSVQLKFWMLAGAWGFSTGVNGTPTEENYGHFATSGGKYYFTIHTGDTTTYNISPRLFRLLNAVVPGTAYMHYKSTGTVHGDWKVEQNPDTKRFNDMNIAENLMTLSRAPYAAVASPSITLPAGTTSLSLDGITKEFATGRNGINPSYQWVKTSGPAATITNGNTANAVASGLTPGNYVFTFTSSNATGGQVASTTLNVTIPEAGKYRARVRY